MLKPIIGITPSPADQDYHQAIFDGDYIAAVEAAGGIAVILPVHCSPVGDLLQAVDGVVLIGGGGDVGPYRYGDETIHPATAAIHDRRDAVEIDLVRAAVAQDIPLLAFCRGSQILNVALGGTMYQDIPSQHGQEVEHRQGLLGIDFGEPSHTVMAEPGSLLERVYGQNLIQANSDHHQASRAAGPEVRVAGRAVDGIIEAVERPGSRFVLGLQWHPELMFRRHPEQLRPFIALVDAARGYRSVVDRERVAVSP